MGTHGHLRYAGVTLGVLCAALVAYAGWRHFSMARHGGGGLFRLVGVTAANGGPICDAEGKKVGFTFGVDGYQVMGNPLSGFLIFETKSLPADVTLCGRPVITPHLLPKQIGEPVSRNEWLTRDGKTRLYAFFDLPQSFLYPLLPGVVSSTRAGFYRQLRSVDVTLQYWRGPRGKADFTFAGPFAAGRTLRAEYGGDKCGITPWTYSDGADYWGTALALTLNRTPRDVLWVIAYDKSGKRQANSYSWVGGRGGPVTAEATISRLWPGDISFITIGEKPTEETFRNVMIVYPGGPFDKSVPPAPKPTGLQDRLAAESPFIRCEAVSKGLAAKDASCVAAAFDLLSDDRETVRSSAGAALQAYAKNLSFEDIQRVGRILASKGDPKVEAMLVQCLLSSDLPDAAKALDAFAADDRPWLWWHARSGATQHAAGEKAAHVIRVRDVIKTGFNGSETDAAIVDDARVLLPTLLLGEFAAADPQAFEKTLAMTAKQCDRKVATAAMIGFLKATDVLTSSDAEPHADRVIGYLSDWYNLGLSRMNGKEPGHPWTPTGKYWRAVVDDAMMWHETGRVPTGVPAGYKASANDVRVILANGRNPEDAVVEIWPARLEGAGRMRSVRLHLPQSKLTIDCELMPYEESGSTWLAVIAFRSTDDEESWESYGVRTQDFHPDAHADLQWAYDCGNNELLHVEWATDPNSVVAGTKAFKEYWEKYVGTPLVQSTDAAVDK